MKFLLVTLAVIFTITPSLAQFRLANMYGDNMVLQMEPKSTQIYGFGTASASVSVQINAETPIQTTVNTDGTWSVRIPPHPAGGPHTLTATEGSNVVSISIWFGDVWVCSGQSNMEMPISQMMDPTGETAKAITYTNFRIMKVSNTYSTAEQTELSGVSVAWSAPNNQNVPGFSALCLMFVERMSDSLNNSRPMGLIDSTWGGTRIEAWSSTRVTTTCNTPPNTGGNQNADHALWNSMMFPLTKMAIRGAIWYQGESNTGYNANLYACHMKNLIDDWRNTFVDGNVAVTNENGIRFPFGIVQLGPTDGGGPSGYGDLRWHQTYDVGYIPNSDMPEAFISSAYDTTDRASPTGDIHPRDKPTVADRFAWAAKNLLWSEPFIPYGPRVAEVSAVVNNIIGITFDMDITVDTSATGFTLLTPGGWIPTTIVSTSGRVVDVSVDSTATQLAYAWNSTVCEYLLCPIYSANSQRVPALPFSINV